MTEPQLLDWPRQASRVFCGILVLIACALPVQAQNTSTQAQTPSSSLTQSWQQLTGKQKQALAPLSSQWASLTPQQQSKWLAISHNFTQLPTAEQATMHSRMADWVALSPQQRTHARYNYNVVQALPKEDKKAKWEAYQALSAEDKRQLSVGTPPPAKSAAPLAKPVSTSRLVAPTQRPVDSARDITRSSPSGQTIDRKTLLPKAAVPVPDDKTPEQAIAEENSSS